MHKMEIKLKTEPSVSIIRTKACNTGVSKARRNTKLFPPIGIGKNATLIAC